MKLRSHSLLDPLKKIVVLGLKDETATVKSFRREKKVDPHKLGTEYRTLYPKGRLSYSQKSEDYYSYIRSWETAQTACYQLPNEKERLKGTTRFIFLHGSERS